MIKPDNLGIEIIGRFAVLLVRRAALRAVADVADFAVTLISTPGCASFVCADKLIFAFGTKSKLAFFGATGADKCLRGAQMAAVSAVIAKVVLFVIFGCILQTRQTKLRRAAAYGTDSFMVGTIMFSTMVAAFLLLILAISADILAASLFWASWGAEPTDTFLAGITRSTE